MVQSVNEYASQEARHTHEHRTGKEHDPECLPRLAAPARPVGEKQETDRHKRGRGTGPAMGGHRPLAIDEMESSEEPPESRGDERSSGAEHYGEAHGVFEANLTGSDEQEFPDCGNRQKRNRKMGQRRMVTMACSGFYGRQTPVPTQYD